MELCYRQVKLKRLVRFKDAPHPVLKTRLLRAMETGRV